MNTVARAMGCSAGSRSACWRRSSPTIAAGERLTRPSISCCDQRQPSASWSAPAYRWSSCACTTTSRSAGARPRCASLGAPDRLGAGRRMDWCAQAFAADGGDAGCAMASRVPFDRLLGRLRQHHRGHRPRLPPHLPGARAARRLPRLRRPDRRRRVRAPPAGDPSRPADALAADVHDALAARACVEFRTPTSTWSTATSWSRRSAWPSSTDRWCASSGDSVSEQILGVIGGSGLYELPGIRDVEPVQRRRRRSARRPTS